MCGHGLCGLFLQPREDEVSYRAIGKMEKRFGKKVFKKNLPNSEFKIQKLMTIYLLKLVDGDGGLRVLLLQAVLLRQLTEERISGHIMTVLPP